MYHWYLIGFKKYPSYIVLVLTYPWYLIGCIRIIDIFIGIRSIIEILLVLYVSSIFYCFYKYHRYFIGFMRIIDILLVYKYHWYFIGFTRIIDILLVFYTCIYMYIHVYATSNRREWGQKKSYRGFRTTPRTIILRSFFLEWSWVAIGAIGHLALKRVKIV